MTRQSRFCSLSNFENGNAIIIFEDRSEKNHIWVFYKGNTRWHVQFGKYNDRDYDSVICNSEEELLEKLDEIIRSREWTVIVGNSYFT